jgi:hypothetical protein
MTDQMIPLVHVMAQLVQPRPGYRLVFAFDQLMSEEHIRELCPDPRFVMTARYLSKRFVVNDEGVATLVHRRGFEVWGVIWEISDVAQTSLDIAMGMPGVFDRFGCFARGSAGEMISTEYYAALNRTPGIATAEYISPIIAAARHRQFPQTYTDELAGWTPLQTDSRSSMHGAR